MTRWPSKARNWLHKRLDLDPPEPFRRAIGEQQQLDLSQRQLVRLIDVLYGLVLVQGAIAYRSVFEPAGHISSAVVLALVLVYYTVVRSFVDYHIAMEGKPYRILLRDGRKPFQSRTLALWQLYVDIFIVGSYSFLLLRGHPLVDDAGVSLRAFFWTLPAVFGLYILWGFLRDRAYGEESEFTGRLLGATMLFYLALAGAYEALRDAPVWSHHWATVNSVALALALALMVLYRHFNWQQQRAYS